MIGINITTTKQLDTNLKYILNTHILFAALHLSAILRIDSPSTSSSRYCFLHLVPARGPVLPPAGHGGRATGTAQRAHHPDPATAVGPCGSAQPPIFRARHAFPLVPGRRAREWQRRRRRHSASAALAERPLGGPRCYQMLRILFGRIR